MIWLILLAYYAISAVVSMGLLEGYGLLLRRVSCLPPPLPRVLSFLLFFALLCVFYLPAFGLDYVLELLQRSDLRYGGRIVYLVIMLIPAFIFSFRYYDVLLSPDNRSQDEPPKH